MNTSFPSLRIEGGLLSGEIIDKIAEASPDIPGQKPVDFGLEPNRPLIDEIASAWNDTRSYWALFQKSLERLKPEDPGTTLTRDRWMVPFFSLLGYTLQPQRKAAGIEGASYFISHRAGLHEQAPPIHITGFRQSLERRPESGVPRLAPHSLVQEYLNRSEELWGIVTNGFTLRLLRDSHLIRRQAYIEFDLKEIMEGDRFADFALLYRLIHATRLPKGVEDADKCLLEQYYRTTVDQGGRVRDHLRDGVRRALIRFGNGFLHHPKNAAFHADVSQNTVEPFEYYQQLLRLIYRFLFLMVSEERGLISDNEFYRQYYSITRVRNLAGTAAAYNEFEDLWTSLRATFSLFTDENAGALLQVPPLNGDLFDPARTDTLNPLLLSNRDLLHAMWDLSMYREKEKAPWRRINYAALDVEELGSVYESLLEFQPVFLESEGKATFDLLTGTERKSTGSYYTPPELVNELIQSALVPVIQDRLKEAKTPAEKEQQLLSLTVCDPACGSGHFLLAAARRIGRELAKVRTGDDEPSPEQMRLAIRDAITHCIYGVDKNPLAIDLCKVALWLEGHTASKPLTFLDHRIRCGDSLVGVFDLSVLKEGIPDEAFTAVTGDDKEVSRKIKTQNKKEREHRQLGEFDVAMGVLTSSRQQVNAIADDRPEDIRRKRELFSSYQREGTAWCKDKTACDLWTSAFFAGLTKENEQTRIIPTTNTVREYLAESVTAENPQVRTARQLASETRFFHWPLEFPEVFVKGGFDCVLGNPPWEKVQPEEIPFYSRFDERIISEKNSANRKKIIQEIIKNRPEIQNIWNQYQRNSELESHFLSGCGRFPYSSVGNINYYRIFTELNRNLINNAGHVGVVIQSGLATDETCSNFLAYLIRNNNIISYFDFINTKKIFDIDSRMKFSLVTLKRNKQKINSKFGFFFENISEIKNANQIIEIDPDIIFRINPNTKNVPTVRNKYDYFLLQKLHKNSIILFPDSGESIVNISIWGEMFNMTRAEKFLITQIERNSNSFSPLIESKLIHQYDHRFGSFENVSESDIKNGNTLEVSENEKESANFSIIPRYFIKKSELNEKLKKRGIQKNWLVGFRSIASPTNERTCIGSILPLAGIANSINLILSTSTMDLLIILSQMNSIVTDFCSRLKVGNQNFNIYIMKQTPILFRNYDEFLLKTEKKHQKILVSNTFELTYTAWDIKAFADDVWRDADDAMKALLRQQWEDNKAMTGGHEWAPPGWAEIEPDGIPLPPFKWDEDRRAVLRAELDALYARLYGLTRDELRYILDPADVYGPDFPGETFRVLKEKEIKKYGEYRTRRLVLEAWDRMEGIDET